MLKKLEIMTVNVIFMEKIHQSENEINSLFSRLLKARIPLSKTSYEWLPLGLYEDPAFFLIHGKMP